MRRYKAILAGNATPDEAIPEIEVYNGSDFQTAPDKKSVTFLADEGDIPAIRVMPSIASIEEISNQPGQEASRSLYAGLDREG